MFLHRLFDELALVLIFVRAMITLVSKARKSAMSISITDAMVMPCTPVRFVSYLLLGRAGMGANIRVTRSW